MKHRFTKNKANRCGYRYQSHNGGQNSHQVQTNTAPTVVASTVVKTAVSTGQTVILTTAEIHSGYQGSKQRILTTVVPLRKPTVI